MAIIIEQEPLYTTLPVGQEIIFAVSNNILVANQTQVKFIAEVHISNSTQPNLANNTQLIGTFKTTPNNEGVGMFDLSSIVESYDTSDNICGLLSEYKGTVVASVNQDTVPPLHLIDKYSFNTHSVRYLAVKFKVEYFNTTNNQIQEAATQVQSDSFKIFNGYLKHTNLLRIVNSEFGYNTTVFQLSSASDKLLTNAPVSQYANIEDYGTIGFLDPNVNVEYFKFSYLDDLGGSLGSDDVATNIAAYSSINQELLYLGAFPANLRNWSATFQALVAAGTIASYTIRAYDDTDAAISKEYTINVNCPTLKNYVPTRLAWLNQWGTWDYYTFTQKSVRSVSTKGSTYTQQNGTWNKSKYRVWGYKGGQKAFRVNAIDKIKMNTDFVNETESEWFEELINSPEVYILEGYQTDADFSLLNTYVTPVRLTTSSYIRKTIANDKLMQYTFEVEKSRTLRTQAV